MKYVPIIVIIVTVLVLSIATFTRSSSRLEERLDIHENILIELNNRLKLVEGNP